MFTMPAFDVKTQFSTGYGTISPVVEGFWSSPIDIRVRRDSFGDQKWEVEVSHSSGGYEGDNKFPAGRLVAERNFANAILASLELAESLKSQFDVMEESYQQYRKECREADEKKEAERKARLDKDPGFAKVDAELIVAQMLADATKNMRSAPRKFFMRDSDSKVTFICEKYDVKAVFKQIDRWDSRRIAKKDLVTMLTACCSQRAVEETVAA